MRLVSLLEVEKAPRKPRSQFISMRDSSRWDATYKGTLTHYGKVCERLRVEQYRQYAVFTIVDDVPLRMAA